MIQRKILISVLFIFVVISGILIIRSNSSFVALQTTHTPDGYMTHVIATQMNKAGVPKSTLYSPNMVHFGENNATDIDKPHMVILSDQGSPWIIDAYNGKANFGFTQVILWNRVHISRAASADNGPIDLTTSELTTYPRIQFATTDDPVTVKQFGSIAHSQGLRANLKTGIVKLEKQARGLYDTTPN